MKPILINDIWSFCRRELINGDAPDFPHADEYALVDLPHDFAIGSVTDFYRDTAGFYRCVLPRPHQESRHAFLIFDGVYMDSALYVNGQKAGEWKYGYSAFYFDIYDLLTQDENEIVLRVLFRNPNSRWYSGAGIFRDVHYAQTGESYLPLYGTYIHTQKDTDSWTVRIAAETAGGDSLRFTLAGQQMTITAAGGISEGVMHIASPHLWDTDDPYLYTVLIELIKDGNVCDTDTVRMGFRTARFDCNEGFFLNGRHVKLHGVCLHHDLGALGAAWNKAAALRQLRLMKRMGVNAIRTSHNMPAKGMMDLCDEEGLLVDSEAFDMWGMKKTAYDYARFFGDWMPKDVASWIRRDRNHPSVIMWSMGNEIYDTHAGDIGITEMLAIRSEIRRHDPLINAPDTIGSNYMPWENTQKAADILKLIGYNYAERLYESHHAKHPDWMIYGSETYSMVQSRGIYHFPAAENILAEDDLQCSSLGNAMTSWGAQSLNRVITDDRDTACCAGQFVWTGTDYLGEPTPYHTKNSYFGLADTAGFEKDPYYVFKAAWSEDKKPFVHLWPYWDFNEGQLIDVCAVSNVPDIALYLNGQEIGRQHHDSRHDSQLYALFRIPYYKGILEAWALDENGSVLALDRHASFGDAAKLCVSADKPAMLSDGRDMIFLTVTAKDHQGYPVENAVNRVQVRVQGAARLAGMDNGDSTDMDSFRQDNRRMFSGKLLVMLMSDGTQGNITVTLTSPGLESAVISLTALPCENAMKQGVGTRQRIEESAPVSEIPVRKIELTFPDGTAMDRDRNVIRVHADIHPRNATWQDLQWRLTNDAGIDSALAKIDVTGTDAVITGLYDGSLRIRCMAANGTDHACVISQMELTVTDMGTVRLDPYRFISTSLKDRDNGFVSAGNERGIATSSEHESIFGFDAIDFGLYGSDEITLPIFTLNSERYDFEIYDGDPENDGECVCHAVYQKKSIWNVYQEETYRLTKRLRGVRPLYFITHDKMHIKGFVFRKYDRAFSPLNANDIVAVYGDDFRQDGPVLSSISNNVVIDWGELDFGNVESLSLRIKGFSPIPVNTIHIRFLDTERTNEHTIEFEHANDVQNVLVPLPGIAGRKKVEFIFLPGSLFDLHEIQFIREK